MKKILSIAIPVLALAGAAAYFVLPMLNSQEAGDAKSQGAKDVRKDVVIGLQLEPPHLDPTAGAAGAIDEVTYANIFEGLTRIDQNGAVQPALARSWKISDDGKTYVFDLHENVKFHDGSAFDAQDAKFSLERIAAKESENAQKPLYAGIKNIIAPNSRQLIIELSEPDGKFLFSLGWGDAVMVAPESASNNKTNPIGTGPFKFDSRLEGSSVTLVKNEDYWGEAITLEKAEFKFISDPSAALNAVLSGDLDAFPNFPAPENMEQINSDERFAVRIGSTEGETVLAINNKKPPFDDVKVRQAISHAIDRQAIIDGAMFGYGTPIGSHFAPHHPAYVDLVGTYARDLDKAKSLLAEAGLADGFTASIKLPPASYARRGGEIIAAQLREIGIELEIIPVEWNVWLPEVFKGKDYDLTIVSHTEPLDIGIYAREDYYFQYQNEEFNSIIEQVNNSTSSDQSFDLYEQAQRILANDAVNGFLFQLAKHGVWKAELDGLWINAPIQAVDLTKAQWAN